MNHGRFGLGSFKFDVFTLEPASFRPPCHRNLILTPTLNQVDFFYTLIKVSLKILFYFFSIDWRNLNKNLFFEASCWQNQEKSWHRFWRCYVIKIMSALNDSFTTDFHNYSFIFCIMWKLGSFNQVENTVSGFIPHKHSGICQLFKNSLGNVRKLKEAVNKLPAPL